MCVCRGGTRMCVGEDRGICVCRGGTEGCV